MEMKKSSIRLKLIASTVLIVSMAAGQTAFIVDSVATPSLGSYKKYGILVPGNYDPARPYPVLYLLHGHDGSHRDWVDRTSVASFVRDMPMIVVLPDADNSWYVNSLADPSKRYEQYLLDDLRKHVESRYKIDTTRRGIAGLSMGGSGAILYALKRPDLFRFAGSLSGAFVFPRLADDSVRQPVSRGLKQSLRAAFGVGPSAHRDANDVFLLTRKVDTSRAPYIYLVSGIQDGFKSFLPGHREFADSLRAIGIPYEYHEKPGVHSWRFWDREIRPLIESMRTLLQF